VWQFRIATVKKIRNHTSDGVVHVNFLFRVFDTKLTQSKKILDFDVV
jgi:hypothetical protein